MAQVVEKTVTQQTPGSVVTESKTEDTPSQTVMYLIYFILGVLEILLLFRFVLRLTGANPASGFVSFIYSVTRIFIWPFSGIFPTATTQGAVATAVFEPQTLVAILMYAALAWGIVKLVAILSKQAHAE